MLSIASGHGTGNPYLQSIYMARRINAHSGGALIAPWELDRLTDDWWDAYLALDTKLPTMQKGVSKIEQRKAEIRSKHPTYGKQTH